MKRRVVLGLAVGAGGAAVAALLLRRQAAGSAIAWVVKERLGYLRTSAADRERFAQDFLRDAPLADQRLAERERWSGARIEALEERICETFLLSSDFFRNGADESKPVRYVALYEPRRAGCTNPLARFDLD